METFRDMDGDDTLSDDEDAIRELKSKTYGSSG